MAEDASTWVIRAAKEHTGVVLRLAASRGLAHPSAAPTEDPPSSVLVPLRSDASAESVADLVAACRSSGAPSVSPAPEQRPVASLRRAKHSASPRERVVAALSRPGSAFPSELLGAVPSKWEKVGDVAILKGCAEALVAHAGELSRAFCEALHARAVCAELGVVCGELREPRVELLGPAGASTETVHWEGSTRYALDVRKVMFASGNGTERMRFAGSVDATGETVVDMFAGIGYFTCPLACHKGRPLRLYAIEKNPNSFEFLCRNVELNGVKGIVVPVLGDNRTVAQEAVGTANRVLMGYLPTPTGFLHRAFEFLRPEGGVIHYHYLCREEEKQTGLDLVSAVTELGTLDFSSDGKMDLVASDGNSFPPMHMCSLPTAAMTALIHWSVSKEALTITQWYSWSRAIP
eukprot:m51a1_g5475 putative trna methylase trm12p wyeosine biosynthesis (406) ;mRNA; f:291174-292764